MIDEHADEVADIDENARGIGGGDLENGDDGEKMMAERKGSDEFFEEVEQKSEQNRGLGIVHREVEQRGEKERQLRTQMSRDFRQVKQNLEWRQGSLNVPRFVPIRRSTRDRGGGRGTAGEPRNSSRRSLGNSHSCAGRGEWRPNSISNTRLPRKNRAGGRSPRQGIAGLPR